MGKIVIAGPESKIFSPGEVIEVHESDVILGSAYNEMIIIEVNEIKREIKTSFKSLLPEIKSVKAKSGQQSPDIEPEFAWKDGNKYKKITKRPLSEIMFNSEPPQTKCSLQSIISGFSHTYNTPENQTEVSVS